MEYIRDPQKIYDESFRIIRSEVSLSHLNPVEERVVVRMIHTSGDVALADKVKFSPNAANAAVDALIKGAPVLCDANMVKSGVTRSRLPANNPVHCYLLDEKTPALASKIQNTRTAAAVDLWRDLIEGSVVAIGNAPTALFRLLEHIHDGWPRPAVVIGLPVGFVGAAESKELLVHQARNWGLEYITIPGRRGGSALAVAAINALASDKE